MLVCSKFYRFDDNIFFEFYGLILFVWIGNSVGRSWPSASATDNRRFISVEKWILINRHGNHFVLIFRICTSYENDHLRNSLVAKRIKGAS